MGMGGFDLGFDSNFDTSFLDQYGGGGGYAMPDMQLQSGTGFQMPQGQYSLGADTQLQDPTQGWGGGLDLSGYGGGYQMPGNQSGYSLGGNTQFQSPIPQQMEQPPAVGQAGGSSNVAQNAAAKDDDWKKMLMKLGVGGGIGALGSLGSAAMGAMGSKGGPQKSTPLPQGPASVIPQAAPMLPLPGTKASPLISGMPNQVNQSIGLQTQDRMRKGGSTGGLQLY